MIFLSSTQKAGTEAIVNETQYGGGGVGVTVKGGFFYDWCGQQCQWHATRQETPVPEKWEVGGTTTALQGECGGSTSKKCQYGGVSFSHNKSGIVYLGESTSAKEKVTCVAGLETTTVNTATIYKPTTAEGVCVSSENPKGLELEFAGTQDKTELNCGVQSNIITIIPGFGVNLSVETKKTKLSDGCGKAGTDDYEYTIAKQAKVDCSYFPQPTACEQFALLSKTGDFVNLAGTAPLGNFSRVTYKDLSGEEKLSIKTMTTKFGSGDTQIRYSEEKLTLPNLKTNDATYKSVWFYLWEGKPTSSSTSYHGAGLRAQDSGGSVVFNSEELKDSQITNTQTYKVVTLCNSAKDPTPTTETTTLTFLAGTLLSSFPVFGSTKQIGENIALFPTSTTRKQAIAYENFDYSYSKKNSAQSQDQGGEDVGCTINTTKMSNGSDTYWAQPPGSIYLGNKTFIETICTPVDDGEDEKVLPGNPVNKPMDFTEKCVIGCSTEETPYTVNGQEDGPGQTLKCPRTSLSCEEIEKVIPIFGGGGKSTTRVTNFTFEVGDTKNGGKRRVDGSTKCDEQAGGALDQKFTRFFYERTSVEKFAGGVFISQEYDTGILYQNTDNKFSFAKTFSLDQGEKSLITESHLGFAFAGGLAYLPFGGKTTMFSDGGKTTFIALATGPDTRSKYSHDGDVHSALVSSSSKSKYWEQASWPGYGVFRGVITTDTFKVKFEGATTMNAGGWGSSAGVVFEPSYKKLKASIYADGGLNLISSKAKASESSWKTETKTDAFSTSFDDEFSGAYMVKNIPVSFVRTVSAAYGGAGYDFNGVVLSCSYCESSAEYRRFFYPWELEESSYKSYFERGDMSKIHLRNKNSYLWTNPASKFVWGTGHGTGCE